MNHEIFHGPQPPIQPVGEIRLTIHPKNLYSGERGSVESPKIGHGVIFAMEGEGTSETPVNPQEASPEPQVAKPTLRSRSLHPPQPSTETQTEVPHGGEKPPLSPRAARPEVSREDIENPEEYWRQEAREGRITPEEAEEAIEKGIKPMAGGSLRDWLEGIFGRRKGKQPDGKQPERVEEKEVGFRNELERISSATTSEELRRRVQDWTRIPAERFITDLEFLKDEQKAVREAMLRSTRPIPQGEAVRALAFLEGRIARIEEQVKKREEERFSRAQRGRPEAYFTPEEIEVIKNNPEGREEIFERLFARADATPGREFHDAFSMYYDEPIYRAFIDVLREAGLERGVTRYVMEREIREALHNANYVLVANLPTEVLVKHGQQFRAEMADIAFRKKGVTTAFHMYEQALLQVMEENGGYLPYEEVAWDPKIGIGTGRVEQLARNYFLRALKAGAVKEVEITQDEKGERHVTKRLVTEMKEWEITRALALARGMGIVSMRTLEIAARSQIPPGRYASLYAQDIIRDIAPFIHVIGKFGIGVERLALLGFLKERGGQPWSQKELHDFVAEGDKDMRGLLKRGDRFISFLNPYKTGSIFSHTGWRVGDETASAIAEMKGNDRQWIGTGVWIEKLRGQLSEKGRGKVIDKIASDKLITLGEQKWEGQTEYKRAETLIKENLVKIAQIFPLRFYFNLEEVREAVKHGMPNLTEEEKKAVIEDLVFLQEEAVQNQENRGKVAAQLDLNFNLIEDSERRGRAKEFVKIIREKCGDDFRRNFIENLEKRGYTMPFVFGTEDASLDEYDFINTGGTSFARRFRDFGAEGKAAIATIKLIRRINSYQKIEDIITDMDEIYENISQYDESIAREVIPLIAEGVAKTYAKDWWSRLPFGGGLALGWLAARGVSGWPVINRFWHGYKSSYAKTQFGNEAMSWDEKTLRDFTCALQAKGWFTSKELEKLRDKIGATKKHLLWYYIRTYTPLGIGAFLLAMWQEFTKDLTKELST